MDFYPEGVVLHLVFNQRFQTAQELRTHLELRACKGHARLRGINQLVRQEKTGAVVAVIARPHENFSRSGRTVRFPEENHGCARRLFQQGVGCESTPSSAAWVAPGSHDEIGALLLGSINDRPGFDRPAETDNFRFFTRCLMAEVTVDGVHEVLADRLVILNIAVG